MDLKPSTIQNNASSVSPTNSINASIVIVVFENRQQRDHSLTGAQDQHTNLLRGGTKIIKRDHNTSK